MFDWISFEPSQSRWGLFALLFALSIFSLEGSGMIQRWAERHKTISHGLFYIGCVFMALAISVSIFWLAQGSKETTSIDIKDIKTEMGRLENIEQRLESLEGNLNKLLEGIESR
ncbi:hypothetical protein ACFLW8_03685 [Chloroflexota bacterium]